MITGKVKRVLTKKKNHSRGHKVMLKDGTVGRMIKIIKSRSNSKHKYTKVPGIK